jgi:signal peptidase II
MIGGALGNNVDRHVRGAVVDFIDVHAAGYHWPAFNVADSALCLGVFIVLITTWREPKRPSQKKIHL